MLPQLPGDGDTAVGKGDGAGGSRTLDAPTEAEHGDFQPEQGNRPAGIDHEEVQHHVRKVHRDAHPHGRFGVAGCAEDHAEDDAGCPEQHGQVQNEEIPCRQIPDGGIHLHPHGHFAAETGGNGGEEDAHGEHGDHRLGGCFSCPVFIPCADGLGDVGQEAHADGGNGAAHQPADGAGSAHGGGGLSTQGAHHGGVDILHRGLHQLLQHSRPCQGEDNK